MPAKVLGLRLDRLIAISGGPRANLEAAMTETTAMFDYADLQHIIAEMHSKDLFFVGAVPRSGSTWLEILLNAHPEVSCAGEGHFQGVLAPLLEQAMRKYNVFIGQNQVDLQDFAAFPQFRKQHVQFPEEFRAPEAYESRG